MSIVESIKNAVLPDTTTGGGPVVSNARPENDIPGAFPDSDDEEEFERQDQQKVQQESLTTKARDPTADIEGQAKSTGISLPDPTRVPSSTIANPTTTATTDTEHSPVRTGYKSDENLPSNQEKEEPRSRENFGERGPILSSESLGLSPDKHEISRGSIDHHRESHASGHRSFVEEDGRRPSSSASGLKMQSPTTLNNSNEEDKADFAMADKSTTVSEVRPQHLGNEGRTPPPRSPTTGEVTNENELAQPAGLKTVKKNPAVEAVAASESLGQFSGSGSAGESNGGIRNGVLGRGMSHLDTHLGVSSQQTTEGTIPSGGVHNTVLGHGSEHPYGGGIEGSKETKEERRPSAGSGSSGRAKAAVDVVLSGVSDSGLGLGGVHNGVVGHGSHDEEDTRHEQQHRHQAGSEGMQSVSTAL